MLGLGCLTLASCGEDEIVPSIDISPEYESKLALNENSTHADSVIYEWYQKYNTAVLYDFEDNDLTWLWASKLTNYFEKFDTKSRSTYEEDSAAIETVVANLQTQLFDNYADDFLAANLPYKIFITKELHSSYSQSSSYIAATNNDQDNMIVGYLKDENSPFTASKFGDGVTTTFVKIFYESLDPQPTEFVNSKVVCWLNLPTMPIKTGMAATYANVDKNITAEQKVYPDFVDQTSSTERNMHTLNVVGFLKNGATMGAKCPSDGLDYASYIDFITNNPGSYIRQRTQYYWRIAKRASIMIEYQKTYQNEDLIAKQNEKYPDDKVTLDDFSYTEK